MRVVRARPRNRAIVDTEGGFSREREALMFGFRGCPLVLYAQRESARPWPTDGLADFGARVVRNDASSKSARCGSTCGSTCGSARSRVSRAFARVGSASTGVLVFVCVPIVATSVAVGLGAGSSLRSASGASDVSEVSAIGAMSTSESKEFGSPSHLISKSRVRSAAMVTGAAMEIAIALPRS